MNPIRKALDEVRYVIPLPILQRAFLDRQSSWKASPNVSLDEQITSLVIRPRVLVDCNLIGGIHALIDLTGLPQEKAADYLTVIHIPKSRTEGRSIMSALSVGFQSLSYLSGWGSVASTSALAATGSFDNTALSTTAAGVLAAFDRIPMTSTARCDLVAENTIVIRDAINLPPSPTLRCVLANGENMENLPLRAYRQFAELVKHAVKAYIYNQLLVQIDRGELQGGVELGTFKDIVSEYRDSEQNYQDYLTQSWEQIAFMADDSQYSRFILMMTGANR